MLKNKRILMITGIVLLIGLIGFILYLGQNTRRATVDGQVNENVPFEHLEPDTSTQFIGSSSLLDQGVSSKQVDALRQAFGKFNASAKRVIIFGNSVKVAPHDPRDSVFVANFTVSVDDTTYQAKLEYLDLTLIHLYLYDRAGKLVFDSGIIDVKKS